MSEIHMMPGHLIRRLQQISVSIFSDTMKSEGIDLTSPQYAALAILHDHPGIDQATLADMIALDRPTVGGIVERLDRKGLVERRISSTDRRAKSLALTPAGETMVSRMQPIVRSVQVGILGGLSDAETAQFTRLAFKIASQHTHENRTPRIPPAKIPSS